ENDRYKISEGYHVVPPLYTGNFMPPKYDLVLADEDEYVFSELVTSIPAIAISKAKTNASKPKSVGEPLIEDWISDINTGDSKLMQLRINLPLPVLVNVVQYALTVNPTIYPTCVEQFWASAKAKIVNGERKIQALADKKKVIISETSIRSDLKLDDAEGIDCLPTATIFAEL
ncbi:hypothetical protein Tco_0034985, partial [Tanacetum coccineum]